MLDLGRTGFGTAIALAARALCLLSLMLAARADAYVHWTSDDPNTIGRANLDGSGGNPSFITGVGPPTAIALDGLATAPPELASPADFIDPLKQEIHLPGSVFAVTTTRNGKYVFASTSGPQSGIAILKQKQSSASLVRFLATEGDALGLVLTRDGRYLLAAVRPKGARTSPAGVQFIDVRKALAGEPGAILGTVPNSSSAIEVGLSNDGRFVFVANESQDTVSVIDFEKALASGQSASAIVGTIPVDIAPVGLAFSGDGRYLYVTNETAKPDHPGYDPIACKIFDGVNDPPKGHPGPKGILSVIDVRKARTAPHDSVLASVF